MDGGAALISVPIWVYAGYYFAHDLDELVEWVHHSEIFVANGGSCACSCFVSLLCCCKKKTLGTLNNG